MKNDVDIRMEEAVRSGVFPGGVLLAAKGGKILYHRAVGVIQKGMPASVSEKTVFDLASLTKPLVTVPSVMILIQKGLLKLETKVETVFGLPSESQTGKLTIAELLAHTSGLPAHRPYFENLKKLPVSERKACLMKRVLEEKPEASAGSRVEYSDLGFMILGWIVEEIAGKGLDLYVREMVFEPLNIRDLFFPATEHRSAVYASTENCPWREKILCGEVHDDNAWAAGGVSGHAGLFGTSEGVFRLLSVYMDSFSGVCSYDVFDSGLMRQFLTEYKDSGRSLGFDMPSPEGSSSGRMFSQDSVGHLGFTGTSFWMDLEQKVIVILLTNRVNPSRDHRGIRKFRPEIHDAVMRLLKK